MAYLIGHLAGFLLLTLIFAAVAGWFWHALVSARAEDAAERDRVKLLREVSTFLGSEQGPEPGVPTDLEREMDQLRRHADLGSSRVTELERALEAARDRAEEAAGRAAEAERALERAKGEPRPPAIDPAAAEAAAQQSWRLRYFEQRVRYLENQARGGAAPAPEAEPQPVSAEGEDETRRLDWRVRYAEARVRQLEQDLRDAAPAPPPAPVAAPVDPAEDALARWRMVYLEKRVAHLQSLSGAPAPSTGDEEAAEADRMKWRNHYLEARIRSLEAELAGAPASEPEALATIEEEEIPLVVEAAESEEIDDAPLPPLVPAGAEERPPAMPAARGGAPDDFTLIEGVTPMQQSTLNSLGIYHFEQIATWTPANIAWVDQYLRLRGRISNEEWVEQAADLAHEGPAAARRMQEEAAV